MFTSAINQERVAEATFKNAELSSWNLAHTGEFFKVLKSEVIWRLPMLYILFWISLGYIYSTYKINSAHSAVILAGIVTIGVLQVLVSRARTSRRLFDLVYLICGMTAILPLGLFIFSAKFSYSFLFLIFFTQTLCWMLFPWSYIRGICWAVFLFVYWNITMMLQGISLLYSLPLLLLLGIALALSRSHFQAINLNQANLFLAKLCANTQNSFNLLLQFARLIVAALDVKHAALISADGMILKLSGADNTITNFRGATQLTAQAVYTEIFDSKLEHGKWRVSAENIPAKALFFDCLASRSSSFVFFRLKVVDDGGDRDLLLIVPSGNLLDKLAFSKLRKGLIGLLEIYNLSLFTSRTQALSNDTVFTYTAALAERDEEINQLVHMVNNNAQEITGYCDSIKENVTNARALSALSEIEDTIRSLTQNVSDIKLLREMSSLRSFSRKEGVGIRSVLAEWKQYCEKSCRITGCALNFKHDFQDDLDGIVVPSIDYLETVLRLLTKTAVKRATGSGKIEIHVWRSEHTVNIDIRDNGEPLGEEVKNDILRGRSVNNDAESGNLRAVLLYAQLGEGSFEFLSSSELYTNNLRLALPYARLSEKQSNIAGNWVLLIDDNPQVVNFYARVAEALGLNYRTAVTRAQALEALSSIGPPRLVITDIQLEESSGLDLVVELRERYGRGLPIIVVSGNDSDEVSSRAYSAGASKYLKKPLGRRKLFSEIEELIK